METDGATLRGVWDVGGGIGARPEAGAALARAWAVAGTMAGSTILVLAMALAKVWVLAA